MQASLGVWLGETAGPYRERATVSFDHRKDFLDHVVRVLYRFRQALDSVVIDVLVKLPGCFLNVGQAKRTSVLGLMNTGNLITPVRLVSSSRMKPSNLKQHGGLAKSLCYLDVVNSIVAVVEDVHDFSVVEPLGVTQTTRTVHDDRGDFGPQAGDVVYGLFGVLSHRETAHTRRERICGV